MIGQTLSHYRMLDKLGQGGMGVVYKAEDTRLNRTVAIKLLAAQIVASDADRRRFYREARAAAALHHPNIATVFEIDETEAGHPFIVMEFIEGQQLDVGLAERPLPLEEAVEIALQIAEALKAAHEKDIVRRDVKPANVMLTNAGRAKVLDFGLAKTTASTKLTQLGSTVGTVSYMSPEQARGEEVDRRTDLWSLGVVLYEMISGQLPFPGDYEQSVMYGILNAEAPPLTGLRTGVPPALEQVVAKCLRKDRALRYQHADDLIADLRAINLGGVSGFASVLERRAQAGSSGSAPRTINLSFRTLIPWVIAAAALGVALMAWLTRASAAPPLPLTSALDFEEGAGLAAGAGRNLALSPDGTQLVYVTSASFDGGKLWIRDLSDGSARPLTGTEGAERPFWSPDGSMLGYFAGPALRVVPAKGGPSIRLASAPQPAGGAWNTRGVILYNPAAAPLFQIPAAGGAPKQVTQLRRQGELHRSPVFLPDGRHFLFWLIDLGEDDTNYIFRGDLETGQIEQLREGGDPTYVTSGFLVFIIGSDQDLASIFAQRFDPENGVLTGQPLPILSDLRTPDGNAVLSVTNRTIVFAPKLPGRQDIPILANRKGGVLDSLAHRERAFAQRFSHNGRQVAFAFKELWVHDLSREISERIPTEVTWPFIFAWSPDDSSIVYSGLRVRGQLRVVRVDGTAKEKTIFQSDAGHIESQ